MKIIAIMNQKGGVGKTTTTVNFAAGLAKNGKHVLLVDADLQANATTALGLQVHQKNNISCDLFAVLTSQCDPQQAILERMIVSKRKQFVLHVIPATIALSGFDQVVRALPNKQLLLKQMLTNLDATYDYVLIDCPPSLGLMTINSLIAADEVIIPVQPEFFALQGISQLLDTVTVLQKSLNPKLKIAGVLCTRFNRRKIHSEVLSCLQDRFEKELFATKIHENIALAEAPSFGKTIFEYSPQSNGSYDFESLVTEFINKEIRKVSVPVAKTFHEYAKS